MFINMSLAVFLRPELKTERNRWTRVYHCDLGRLLPLPHTLATWVHISHVELAVDIPVTQEVLQEPNSNVVKVAFTVRKAGRYEITVKLGGLNVAYSPYYKIFQPGRFVVHSLVLPLLYHAFFVLAFLFW